MTRAPKPAAEKPAKPAAKVKVAGTNARPALKDKPAKPAAPARSGQGASKTAPASTAFKVKDLVAAVVAATGGKKPEVKKSVEATLAALADALKRGADLSLPPLGRARIVKSEGKNGEPVMTLKLRIGQSGKPDGKEGLADTGEDS